MSAHSTSSSARQTDVEVWRPELPVVVESFQIKPDRGPPVEVEGSTRFVHERDFAAFKEAANAELERLKREKAELVAWLKRAKGHFMHGSQMRMDGEALFAAAAQQDEGRGS